MSAKSKTKSLTVKSIAKLKPIKKKDPKTKKDKLVGCRYRDQETRGLYLQVGPTGTKSWLLRYEYITVERFMGLGPYPTFSLKEAREGARGSTAKVG